MRVLRTDCSSLEAGTLWRLSALRRSGPGSVWPRSVSPGLVSAAFEVGGSAQDRALADGVPAVALHVDEVDEADQLLQVEPGVDAVGVGGEVDREQIVAAGGRAERVELRAELGQQGRQVPPVVGTG